MGKFSMMQQTKWVSAGPDGNKKDLTGRVVIVTGASAGLGEECARQFAKMNPGESDIESSAQACADAFGQLA